MQVEKKSMLHIQVSEKIANFISYAIADYRNDKIDESTTAKNLFISISEELEKLETLIDEVV